MWTVDSNVLVNLLQWNMNQLAWLNRSLHCLELSLWRHPDVQLRMDSLGKLSSSSTGSSDSTHQSCWSGWRRPLHRFLRRRLRWWTFEVWTSRLEEQTKHGYDRILGMNTSVASWLWRQFHPALARYSGKLRVSVRHLFQISTRVKWLWIYDLQMHAEWFDGGFKSTLSPLKLRNRESVRQNMPSQVTLLLLQFALLR